MKILLLTDTLDVGGAETHIYELSRSLLFHNNQIVIFSRGGKIADSLKSIGITVHEYPRGFTRALSELLELLRSFKPDTVHAHTRKTLVLAQAANKIIPFPLVFTAHAKFSHTPLKRFMTRPPRFTVAVSEDVKTHFIARFGGDRDKIAVIENGIDTDRFHPQEKEEGHHVLSVSRLDRDCSVCAKLLCRLSPKLARIYPDFRLTLVGGGNDFAEVERLANEANRQIGHRAVFCAGACADVLPFIQKCDVFVGVSRAALEAMSCNKPTVICGNEGYFGICNAENFEVASHENFCARGYGYPDSKRLFEDIKSVFSKYGSSLLRLRKNIIKNYRSEQMAKKVYEIYLNATADFKKTHKYDAVLCGYYGFGNAGDELVKNKIITSLSSLRLATVGAHGENRIWRFNIPLLCLSVKNSSGVILGGGSLLQNSTSRRSLEYYLFVLKIASFYGKKIMLYANGLGPLKGKKAELACKRALSRVDVASFRDRESFDLAKKLLPQSTLCYLTCDPALTPVSTAEKNGTIAVFIRDKDYSPRLKKALIQTLSHLQITVAPMSEKHDRHDAKQLADLLSARYNEPMGDGLVRLIAESRIVISSRLHALIIAASAGVPFIALCGDPKLNSFVRECRLPEILAISTDGDLCVLLPKALEYAERNHGKISSHLKKICAHLSPCAKNDARNALELFGNCLTNHPYDVNI